MGEWGARPSRRDLLAGAVGGVAGLAAGAGLEALRGAAPASPASADLPFVLGKESSGLPEGLVRADLRAYHSGSGSDYHDAFAAALEAADVVYVPPGIWITSQTIAVGAGKVLWSDAGYDRPTVPVQGAIIRAGRAMAATVRMTGAGATLSGLVVDGADSADAAVEFAADEVELNDISARRGVTYALKAIGERCTIWGGLFQQTGSKGFAMYQKGADMILWGARIKRGQIPLWIEGSGGMLGVLHVTGVAGAGGGSSTATVKLTGPRNTLVDVFYDTAAGPSILLESGASSNQCIGMNFRNRYSAGTFPAIRCDASGGQVLNNLFDGFFTDDAGGDGWSSLIEMIGGPGDLAGNVLGRGHADSCRVLWNTRPSLVGDIVSNRRLTRNSGSATLSSGTRSLKIPHGLKGAPLSVTVSVSKGSAPNPDLAVDATTIDLSWPAAPGSLVVYWRAEM